MQPFPDKEYPAHLKCADAAFSEFLAGMQQLMATQATLAPVEFCRCFWALLRPLYVTNPADAGKLGWEPCDLPNELGFLRHWMGSIQPSIQALRLTEAGLSRVQTPVLTIHGRRDRSAPYGGGREWAHALGNARLLTVEDAAHVPWIEAPDAVFGAIDTFLRGEWPAAALKVTSVENVGNLSS
jgi:pimeloyl-ACP methyl ester carboxylesterase